MADFYSTNLENPQKARNGVWDIAAPGWVPDCVPTSSRCSARKASGPDGDIWGTNWGLYENEKVNKLIQQATTASSTQQANRLWQRA